MAASHEAAPPQRPRTDAVGRRHQLTVLFTDLCGSTALGEVMEVEPYAELMQQVRDIWHQAAQQYQGLVLRSQGDGALIIFGYPASGETDGSLAADTALAIHERVRQLANPHLPPSLTPLAMRSGVHSGVVLLAPGDLERGRLDLSGAVVNTTAKLLDSAPPGGIVATLHTLGPHANLFDLTPLPHSPESTPSAPHKVHVLRRNGASSRFEATARRGLTTFIGREEAMAFLRPFATTSNTASVRCAVVQGTAGMGKTRLLEEFVMQHSGSHTAGGPAHHRQGASPAATPVRILRGTCETSGTAQVLQPFRQMLRGLLPGADAAALLEQFKTLHQQSPLLMLIDDWQWADDASRQLLLALLQWPQGPRVVLASRPREDHGLWIAEAPHLNLHPFAQQQTATAVQRWLPQADPFLMARIHHHAGGVPLFIEELCHSASVDSLDKALQGHKPVQGWLGTLVASRLARLPKDQAAVVRVAAVLGTEVPCALLETVLGAPVSEHTLDQLAVADFLYSVQSPSADGAAGRAQLLRFKHGITREAVYEAIGLYERTALHESAVAALLASAGPNGAEPDLDALAHHARGAGDWARAAELCERCGDAATKAFAMDRARQQYRAALDALDHLAHLPRNPSLQAKWCSVANKLGLACVFDPLSLSDGLAIFERATAWAAELDDTNLHARSRYWLSYMSYSQGLQLQGIAHARHALQLARSSGDIRLASQVEATLGQVLASAGEYAEAMPLMNAALDHKRMSSRPGSGLAVGSAYTLACKGSVHADQGDFAHAKAAFDHAMHLLADSTHPVGNSARNWVAISRIWQGDWQGAQRVAQDSATIATNTRLLLLLAVSRAVQGYARWCAGQDEGLTQLRESVQWITARGNRFYTSLFYSWLAQVAAAEGRFTELRQCAAVVLRRAKQGETIGLTTVCRLLALHQTQQRRPTMARLWFQQAQQSAQARGSRRESALNQMAQAQALLLHNPTPQARATAQALHEAAHTELLHMGVDVQACEAAVRRTDTARLELGQTP